VDFFDVGKLTSNLARWIQTSVQPKVDAYMDQQGKVWKAEARRLCPVRTGQLRDSIGYYYDQRTKTLTLYADKFYAGFVEFGTRNTRAQPFMRPAMRVMGSKRGVTIQAQLPMMPEKYRQKTRVYTGNKMGGHKLILGHPSAR
jgi:HK97 gp10 family phage protein